MVVILGIVEWNRCIVYEPNPMAVEKENVRRDLQAREHEMEKDSFSHPEQGKPQRPIS